MSETVSVPAFLANRNTCSTHISIKPFHQTLFGYPVVKIFYIGPNTSKDIHESYYIERATQALCVPNLSLMSR